METIKRSVFAMDWGLAMRRDEQVEHKIFKEVKVLCIIFY